MPQAQEGHAAWLRPDGTEGTLADLKRSHKKATRCWFGGMRNLLTRAAELADY